MMRFVLSCVLGLAVLPAVFAQPAWADSEMETMFRTWAINGGFSPAAMVARDSDGVIYASAGVNIDVITALPIASISKTVSGQCAVHMAHEGLVSLDDPVSAYLGWDAPQGTIALANLLTHTSGLGPDETQRDVHGSLLQSKERIAELVSGLATRDVQRLPGTYEYNNENYLLLEAVLDVALKATVAEGGTDYSPENDGPFSWCAQNHPSLGDLASLGVASDLRGIGFAGGFEISAEDLSLLFHRLAQPPQSDWPKALIGGWNFYGPGIIMQEFPGGQNLFHVGGVCTPFGPNLGAFAARMANGNAIAMIYSNCAAPDDLVFLNSLVLRTGGH